MPISRVLPIMSVYRLPHGQYGYSGHIFNLPQDVTSFLNSLPRCPSTIDLIIVRKEGSSDSHKDFRVRRSVVLRALQWLTINNKYYHDVTINHDILATIPDDSHLTNLASFNLHSCDTETNEVPPQQEVDPYNVHLHSTFVPLSARSSTEHERIQSSIMNPHVNWPPTTGNPINEFTSEGYTYLVCISNIISCRYSRFIGTSTTYGQNCQLF